jgi:hypothetical protein
MTIIGNLESESTKSRTAINLISDVFVSFPVRRVEIYGDSTKMIKLRMIDEPAIWKIAELNIFDGLPDFSDSKKCFWNDVSIPYR